MRIRVVDGCIVVEKNLPEKLTVMRTRGPCNFAATPAQEWLKLHNEKSKPGMLTIIRGFFFLGGPQGCLVVRQYIKVINIEKNSLIFNGVYN